MSRNLCRLSMSQLWRRTMTKPGIGCEEMKLTQQALNKPCPKCRRLITQEVIDERVNSKAVNARSCLAKAKINGNKSSRRSTVDWNSVIKMRKSYMKISAIARVIGVSRSYLSRAMKVRKIK